jgi:hypothetical protein
MKPLTRAGDDEVWQQVRQTSPEMATRAQIIRVLRRSLKGSRTVYSNTAH